MKSKRQARRIRRSKYLEDVKKIKKEIELPSKEQVIAERERIRVGRRFRRTFGSTVGILLIAAAVAILIATLVLPVFRIFGTSMTPTLTEGQMVAAVKTENLKRGDLVAFYYNNKILVKRVIATAGEWVNIDAEGNVFIDDKLIDEPYLKEKSLGECDIELPYQVPDQRIFVMGDHRDVSVDSRTTAIGCISQEQIAGKLILRIWPLRSFGKIK